MCVYLSGKTTIAKKGIILKRIKVGNIFYTYIYICIYIGIPIASKREENQRVGTKGKVSKRKKYMVLLLCVSKTL